MTGSVCAVSTCRSNSITAKRTGHQLSFFRFPKNPKVRKEWVRRCYKKGILDPSNKRICSRHFTSTDFEDGIKAQLMNKTPIHLKSHAIPTKNLLKIEKEEGESPRVQRARKKKQKALVEALLKSTSPVPQQGNDTMIKEPEVPMEDPLMSSTELFPIFHLDHDYCREPFINCQVENITENLLQKIGSQSNALTIGNERLKQELREKDTIISVVKGENATLHKKVLESNKQNFEQILNEKLTFYLKRRFVYVGQIKKL